MKTSWRGYFKRVASVCLVGGAGLWHSAICYATVAFDSASDPVYNDGWQAGDNGGTGFTAWDFSSAHTFHGVYYGQYAHSDFHAIDDGLRSGTHYSNPFNNIGRAWDVGYAPGADGPPRAGRGFTLGIGETFKVVFDNPTEKQFFKGYQINFNGGTGKTFGNISYGGDPSNLGETTYRKVSFATFEYIDENNEFTNGQWGLNDATGSGSKDPLAHTHVYDTDTAAAGAMFSLTRTGTETYDATIDSFGPGADFSATNRMMLNAGEEIDWFEITFFNTPTDLGTPPTSPTDLYIRSLQIVGPSPAADFDNNGRVDGNDFLIWQRNFGLTTGATKAQGNANPGSDGDVDAADLAAWKSQFGTAAVAAAASAPEPTGWIMAIAAMTGASLSLRGRGQRV